MEERIRNLFEKIGLKKNEQSVYLDLLKHGRSTALEIAKRTGIHRTNTYDALNTLIARGFISEEITSGSRLFVAGTPEKLVTYIEHLHHEAKEIIPELKYVTHALTAEHESVQLSKGTFAVRAAILDLLSLSAPVHVHGASKEMLDILGASFIKDFHKQRIRKKIVMRHIYNENMIERTRHLNSMKYTFARYLPQEYTAFVSTNICGNRVVLVVPSDPPSVITINNEKIATSYFAYFEALWKQARSP